MLEDSSMEKKSAVRSGLPTLKGSGTETKAKQDAVNGKPFSKPGRRREPPGSSGPKSEPNRKPFPQKSKAFDKRPRPRAQYFNNGKDSAQIAEAENHEDGSLSHCYQGSKKQNLNHLLNFHYTPRDAGHYSSYWSGDRNCRGGRRKWAFCSASRPKYNKEQFLQANCQFIVKAAGDYTVHLTDPDILVEWDNIEQICLKSHDAPWCPICLYPPVAAKITRCGHIFCWSCVLHYLSLSNNTWRKCPICYESIHKHDLKSVISIPFHQYKIGEEITMRLMRRDRLSLFAVPVMQHEPHLNNTLLSVSETAVDTVLNKLLLANADQVKQMILNRERAELLAQLAEEADQPEACFTEEALELLTLREKINYPQAAVDIGMFEKMKLHDDDMDKALDDSFIPAQQYAANQGDMKQVVVYESAFDDKFVILGTSANSGDIPETASGSPIFPAEVVAVTECDDAGNPHTEAEIENRGEELTGSGTRTRHDTTGSEDGETITAKDLDISTIQKANTSGLSGQQPKPTYYFYQSADGQHIYLHALNSHMLAREYGSLENCPLTITGRIIEKDSTTMTEELRNRLRYLKHLPVTCQFEVVELCLQPPVVTQKVISEFQGQMDKRRKDRIRRARQERRREKRIEEEENIKLGHYPPARFHIKSKYHFPEYRDESMTVIQPTESPVTVATSLPGSPVSSAVILSSSGTELLATSPTTGSEGSCNKMTPVEQVGPSFAQMVREGKMKPPLAKPAVNSSTEGHYGHGVTRPRRTSDSDTELEEYAAAPEFHHSFSDAITLALEKAATEKRDATVEANASGGRKKKKGKQKLLFTTRLSCPGK